LKIDPSVINKRSNPQLKNSQSVLEKMAPKRMPSSGWVVVEAEQDPAKAAPRIYTEKAYQYVKNLLF